MRVATNGHRPARALSVAEINALARRKPKTKWRHGMVIAWLAALTLAVLAGYAAFHGSWTGYVAALIGIPFVGCYIAERR